MVKYCAIPGCGCKIAESGFGEYYDWRSGKRVRCSMQTMNRVQYCCVHAAQNKYTFSKQSHARARGLGKIYNAEQRKLIAMLREENRIQAEKLARLGVVFK